MRNFLLLFALFCSACSDTHRVIKIKGSDTEVNLAVNLAERFHEVNPAFTVSISGGGSGLGIASILNGQADIANSSRPLTNEEKDMFAKAGIEIKSIAFAEDATAFIVHKDSPIDSISVPELAKLLSGQLSSWRDITGKELPVTIYGRQSNSGTHSFVQKKLRIAFSRNAKEMSGNAQIIESIKQDASGIGYVGAGYVSMNSQGVKVLKISDSIDAMAISPLDKSAIKSHQYFFQRPLYQFIPAASWEKVQGFLEFENGTEGRTLIENEGYYILQ